MTKRSVALAPITVTEGGFEYSDMGLSIGGHRRAETEYLRQITGDSPFPEGPARDAFIKMAQRKFADHKWLIAQLNFYGVDCPNPLLTPVEELCRRLKVAVDHGDVSDEMSFLW